MSPPSSRALGGWPSQATPGSAPPSPSPWPVQPPLSWLLLGKYGAHVMPGLWRLWGAPSGISTQLPGSSCSNSGTGHAKAHLRPCVKPLLPARTPGHAWFWDSLLWRAGGQAAKHHGVRGPDPSEAPAHTC